MSNEKLEQLLSYDALHDAEKITGVSYKEDEGTSSLGMLLFLTNNKEKRKLLKANNDSHYGISVEEYLEILKTLGFTLLLTDPIKDTNDTFSIYWHTDGLMLTLETYNGESINSTKVYFNYRGPRDALYACANGWAGEYEHVSVWDGEKDVREGIVFSLSKLREHGSFLPRWIRQPFLWLVDYKESKVPGYDYKAITAARITRLPVEVQYAIYCER